MSVIGATFLIYCAKKHRIWAHVLKDVELKLNVTGELPYEAMYRRKFIDDIDRLYTREKIRKMEQVNEKIRQN